MLGLLEKIKSEFQRIEQRGRWGSINSLGSGMTGTCSIYSPHHRHLPWDRETFLPEVTLKDPDV